MHAVMFSSADHNYNEVHTDNSYHANLHFSWHVHSKSFVCTAHFSCVHTLAKVSWNTQWYLIPYTHTIHALHCVCSPFFSFVTPTAKQGLNIGTSRGKQKHIHPYNLMQAWYSEGQRGILSTILLPAIMLDYTSMGTNPAIIGCCSKLHHCWKTI